MTYIANWRILIVLAVLGKICEFILEFREKKYITKQRIRIIQKFKKIIL